MSKSKRILEENEPGLGRKSSSEESNGVEEEANVQDYVDKAGRRWHFLCHTNEEEDLAQFCQQNGLVPGNENGKRRKFGCSRPECHFRTVFLKARSGIYTRGEHWHEQVDGIGKTSGDVLNDRIVCSLSTQSKIVCRAKEEFLIDRNGKEFKLVRRFESNDDFEEYRRENWLMKLRNCKKRMKLHCRRHSNRNKMATNCQVLGVYVKRDRSFYQNDQQHNHPMGEDYDCFSHFLSKYAEDRKADYVDHLGQHWHFLRKIDNFKELQNYVNEQMLYHHGNKTRRLFYFTCKYAHRITLKNHPYPPPYCQMRAVFIKATSSVYVRNEHSHHPAFEMKSTSKHCSRHGRIFKYFTNNGEDKKEHADKNKQKNRQNAEQNEPIPMKEEEADSEREEEDVRIVKHLQRDYKCLGRMKREEEQGRTDMECWPVHGEEEDLEAGTSQGTRGRKRRSTFYRYPDPQRELPRPIKKDEPADEAEEEGALPVPPQMPLRIAIQMPQGLFQPHQPAEAAQPAKMLLRERKRRINYGK